MKIISAVTRANNVVEEADRLDTKPGSPLLELTQIGFLDSGAAFEYSVSRNVGDRFELHNVTLA